MFNLYLESESLLSGIYYAANASNTLMVMTDARQYEPDCYKGCQGFLT